MAASIKSSSRYNSFDSQTSSSSEFRNNSSKALARSKSSDPVSSMVKKLMERRSKPSSKALFIPAAQPQDLKKTTFSSIHRKLFHQSDKEEKKKKPLALADVKSNTRTLAMLLRSERELLNENKEQEAHIAELKLMLQDSKSVVDKLKDLCLKQREEIQHLQNAILFPPPQPTLTLQRQVTSLTDQLHCLAHDLALVKADQFATNSLECACDGTAPSSPEDIFFQDFNPCLTPYSTNSKPKEVDEIIRGGWGENHSHAHATKSSKSSDQYCKRNGNIAAPPTWHQFF